ncbi:MAG: acetyl-CoA carboxylase biotin carboxyl carrier protein [Oscillospiraceae bacterium]
MSNKIYDFDLETIAKLADIVKEKDLGEITVTTGEKSITVKGRKCPPPPPMGGAPFMPAPMDPMPATVNAAAPNAAPTVEAQAAFTGNVVRSPIVGTFYAAASPEKPPFAEVGKKVKKGDVLMIIESMKLMNEIQSEFDGTVTRILVKNGEAVEFDQPLMVIE